MYICMCEWQYTVCDCMSLWLTEKKWKKERERTDILVQESNFYYVRAYMVCVCVCAWLSEGMSEEIFVNVGVQMTLLNFKTHQQ